MLAERRALDKEIYSLEQKLKQLRTKREVVGIRYAIEVNGYYCDPYNNNLDLCTEGYFRLNLPYYLIVKSNDSENFTNATFVRVSSGQSEWVDVLRYVFIPDEDLGLPEFSPIRDTVVRKGDEVSVTVKIYVPVWYYSGDTPSQDFRSISSSGKIVHWKRIGNGSFPDDQKLDEGDMFYPFVVPE